MKFGEFIKTERSEKEWTQPQAAEEIGIEQSYLSKLENNKAIPSADIFDQLMKAYGFDMQKVGEKVSDSELSKLKEIVLIRDFIVKQRVDNTEVRRKWLKLGLIAIVIGTGLISFSIMNSENARVTHSYRYESKGIIKDGESRYLYAAMPTYQQFLDRGQHPMPYKLDPVYKRLDYDIKRYNTDNGEFFDTITEKGSRRYLLTSVREKEHKNDLLWLFATAGIMLLAGGLSSLYISRRW
jgi:transcriptional regulator with XRE-family HTH domain